MGDASTPIAQASLQSDNVEQALFAAQNPVREVHVLVTGFGEFKSFGVNPSYLIASKLSRSLNPESESVSAALDCLESSNRHRFREPVTWPYIIKVHAWPTEVKVAYDFVHELIPQLVADHKDEKEFTVLQGFSKPPNGFDFVLHIGMAAGRKNYTLETVAHRDHYKLEDVDGKDGSKAEAEWRAEKLPDVLPVGWSKEEVLSRWIELERKAMSDEMGKAGWKPGDIRAILAAENSDSKGGQGKSKPPVDLSSDAGRYLCEFIFYTSLSTRWSEAHKTSERQHARDIAPTSRLASEHEEKEGKVAFLHVPGGTTKHDIERGVRIAESAIIAIVGSWMDGFRNPLVYGDKKRTLTTVDAHAQARAAAVISEMMGQ